MLILDDPSRFFGADGMQDPYPLYAQMRAQAPVHRIGDSDFFAVCSWNAVVEAVGRVEDFSSNLTAAMVYAPDGSVTSFPMGELGDAIQALATADDPAHAVHRKILLPHLSARRVRIIEAYAEQTAAQLWADSLCDNEIEWMSAMANRLPMMVVARLLGLPDDDVDTLIERAYRATSVLDGITSAERLDAAGVAAIELSGYILEHFEKASTSNESGLIADLSRRCAAGEVDRFAALGIMITLFGAAGESTASLLGSAAWILSSRPDIQRQLRENPYLLGAFIEETLRYEPPFRGHYRHVLRDTTLGGVDVPAHSRLLLMWGAANRDPQQFDAPDAFRLDRASAKGHIAFGKGVHFCVGAALARLEAKIVLGTVLQRSSWIDAADVGGWLPSVLVRRLERLQLTVRD